MKMYLISDNVDTVTGMRLAGVDSCVVHEKEELDKALKTVLDMTDVAILLVTEKINANFAKEIDVVRTTYKKPLVLEIPDRHGYTKRADFITAYINEAIGVKL